MPTSNEEEHEIQPPKHPCLEITSVCTQSFNRCEFAMRVNLRKMLNSEGSRRLITYRRLADSEVVVSNVREQRAKDAGVNADDLNPFRKRYFEGFKS